MGDSHAALFAHAGWRPGQVKATYGTGSSIMSLGRLPDHGSEALCATIAWDDGTPQPAVEGNIRASGATLTWLAAVLETSPEALAERAAPSSEGVRLVSAFGGLGAVVGRRGRRADLRPDLRHETPHLARAALESIAFQVEDVVAAVDREIALGPDPAGRR